MDVNATLARMRELYVLMVDGNPKMIADYGQELAELAESLDGWMTGGGYLPQAWM
jgi:hypothetical protein